MQKCWLLSQSQLADKLAAGYTLLGGPFASEATCHASCNPGEIAQHHTQVAAGDLPEAEGVMWHHTQVAAGDLPEAEGVMWHHSEVLALDWPINQALAQHHTQVAAGDLPEAEGVMWHHTQVAAGDLPEAEGVMWHHSEVLALDWPITSVTIWHHNTSSEYSSDNLVGKLQHSTHLAEQNADGLADDSQHNTSVFEQATDGGGGEMQHNTNLQESDTLPCGDCPDETGTVTLVLSGTTHEPPIGDPTTCDGEYPCTWNPSGYWVAQPGICTDMRLYCSYDSMSGQVNWYVELNSVVLGSGSAPVGDGTISFGAVGVTTDCDCEFSEGETTFQINWTC